MKNNYLPIIFIIILALNLGLCAYDIQLNRFEHEYSINTQEQADLNKIQECSQSMTDFKHTQYYISVDCMQSDVVYNIDISLGNIHKKYSTFKMAVDLTSPYTWIKEENCSKCDKLKIELFVEPDSDSLKDYLKKKFHIKQTQKKKTKKTIIPYGLKDCDKSCAYNNKFQSLFTPDVQNEKFLEKQMLINSNFEDMVSGSFIQDQAFMYVYNENKKIEDFKQFIEYELKQNYNETLGQTIQIPNIDVIYAHIMYGLDGFQADGAIGLGYIDSIQDENSYIQNTNFIEQLSSRNENASKQFGLYLGEVCDYQPDFIVTLGGYSEKYTHTGKINPKYIPLVKSPGRAQYWAVLLEMINIGDFNKVDRKQIHVNQIAVLTSTSSFIALPLNMLQAAIFTFNEEYKMDCSIVDSKYFQVYCKKVKAQHAYDIKFQMKFQGQEEVVKLDVLDIFRKCQEKVVKNYENKVTEEFDCILSLRASRNNHVVLGEPFLKQHYTLFDMEKSQIGLLPTVRDSSFFSQFRRSLFSYLIHISTFSFILLIIFVCFYKQIRRVYKNIRNTIRARNLQTELGEIQRLNTFDSQNNSSAFEENYDEEQYNKKGALAQQHDVEDTLDD